MKLIHQIPNAVTAGREVDMLDVLKHELSHVPLSLAKTTSTCKMNTKIGTNNYNNQ